jgi:hypothetical protein
LTVTYTLLAHSPELQMAITAVTDKATPGGLAGGQGRVGGGVGHPVGVAGTAL